MNYKTTVIALCIGIYVDVCFFAVAYIHLPSKPLPDFFYPIQSAPVIYQAPSPYENDCWGIEDDYCWWDTYDI
jgi:hypothetical protein